MKQTLLLLVLFTIYFSTNYFSQGSTCATAQALNVNGCTNGTDDGFCSTWTAPGGGIVNPACSSAPGATAGQGWYTITTSATSTSWTFEVKKATGGGSSPITNPAFQLYSGACGSLTYINCYDNDNGSGNDEKEVLSLSASTTYYIRVYDDDGAMVCAGGGKNYQWSVCFFDYEPGDDCNNAIPVTLASTCGYTTYSNVNFIESDELDPSCASGTTAEDIWFKFTTDATGRVAVDLRPGTITDTGLEIYSGACNSLISVGCSDDKGISPTYPNAYSARLEGTLSASTQYYARAWKNGGGTGNFEACFRLWPTLSNDACASATPLTLSTSYPMTNWAGTVSAITDPATSACNGSLDNSVWFSFTTTIAGNYIVDLTSINCSQGKGLQVDVGKWSAASCVSANWVSNVCANPGTCGNMSLTTSALTAATTYYVFVDGWGAMGEDAEFNIMVTPPIPLPIELLSFDCEWDSDRIKLLWSTATEENNDYFTIEKSLDGENWYIVSTIKGGGNSMSLMDYEYIDINTSQGTVYYRLSQTDYDGKKETFDITSCYHNIECDAILNTKYYNLLGQEIDGNYKGAVIVVRTYINGKINVEKTYKF